MRKPRFLGCCCAGTAFRVESRHGKHKFGKKGIARGAPQARVQRDAQAHDAHGGQGFPQVGDGGQLAQRFPGDRQSAEARRHQEERGGSHEIEAFEDARGEINSARKNREYVLFSVCFVVRSRSLMDRTQACGACNPGSIPGGSKNSFLRATGIEQEGVGEPAGSPWRKDWENRGFPSWRGAKVNELQRRKSASGNRFVKSLFHYTV